MNSKGASTVLHEIKQVPRKKIGEIARWAVADQSAELLGGPSVEQMNTLSIGNGTIGFFKVSGTASADGRERPWSCVIKAIDPSMEARSGVFNLPNREIEAYRSGLFAKLDRGMAMAPCFSVDDRPDGTVWLWLRDMSEAAMVEWMAEDYVFAAREIGIFNGLHPREAAGDAAWIDRTGVTEKRRGALQRDVEKDLQDALVQRAVAAIGIERAHATGPLLQAAIDATTEVQKTIAHNDSHVRNLFIDRTGPGDRTLFAVDWASVGITPAGLDAGSLIGGATTWSNAEAELVTGIERNVFDSYCIGLNEAGFMAEYDALRLVYLSQILGYRPNWIMSVFHVSTNPDGPMATMMLPRVGAPGPDEYIEIVGQRLEMLEPFAEEAERLVARMS